MKVSMHQKIVVQVDDNFPWLGSWRAMFGDVEKIAQSSIDGLVVVGDEWKLQVRYDPHVSGLHWREVCAGVCASKDGVFDTKYGVRLEKGDARTIVLVSSNAALEWLSWSVQLLALLGGATFVHAAAVAQGGKAVIFPSWGGVGKTALIGAILQMTDARFLGDDFVIVDGTGQCFCYPKPMILYPYHKAIFPNVFANGGGPVAPAAISSVLARVGVRVKTGLRQWPWLLQWSREHNPIHVSVLPSTVFGEGRLLDRAKIASVVWIERDADVAAVQIEDADDELVSQIYGSTLSEFDPWCVRVTGAGVGSGFLNARMLHKRWLEVLESAVRQARFYRLIVPRDAPVGRVGREMVSELQRAGILS